jgi:hypothetical protein
MPGVIVEEDGSFPNASPGLHSKACLLQRRVAAEGAAFSGHPFHFCRFCEYNTRNSDSLGSHMRQHYNFMLICGYCFRKCSWQLDTITKHFKTCTLALESAKLERRRADAALETRSQGAVAAPPVPLVPAAAAEPRTVVSEVEGASSSSESTPRKKKRKDKKKKHKKEKTPEKKRYVSSASEESDVDEVRPPKKKKRKKDSR